MGQLLLHPKDIKKTGCKVVQYYIEGAMTFLKRRNVVFKRKNSEGLYNGPLVSTENELKFHHDSLV